MEHACDRISFVLQTCAVSSLQTFDFRLCAWQVSSICFDETKIRGECAVSRPKNCKFQTASVFAEFPLNLNWLPVSEAYDGRPIRFATRFLFSLLLL